MFGVGKLRSVLTIARILGKEGFCELRFDIRRGKLTARQAIVLNRVEEELPSTSDVTKADCIELQEIMENAVRSTDDLIAQFDDPPGGSLQHLTCVMARVSAFTYLICRKFSKWAKHHLE